MKKRGGTLVFVLAFVLILSAAGAFYYSWRESSVFVYFTHQSPNGRFMIQVLEYPQLLGHFPGDSGSGRGYVQLVDRRTGEILEKKVVDPVLVIDTVYWDFGSVDVKLFEEWQLPK